MYCAQLHNLFSMVQFAVNIRFYTVTDSPFTFVFNGLGMNILHGINGLHHFGRNTHDEGIRRNNGVLGHHGAGSNDRAPADLGTIEDGGMHANQYMVFNLAGMDDSAVADGYIVTDDAGIVVCYVEAAEILHIGTFTDGNIVYIAPGNDTWPDAGIFTNSYIAERNVWGATKAFSSICGSLPLNALVDKVYITIPPIGFA